MDKDFERQKEKILQWFHNWAVLKPKIHFSAQEPGLYFRERQIWWTSIGQNIGSEENGKNKNFERPVLVFKKFNKDVFLGMPISTKIKIGDYRYVFVQNGKQFCLNTSQMRVMSSKRLLRLIGRMQQVDYANIVTIYKGIIQK